MSDAIDREARPGRRGLLVAGAATAGAMALTLVGQRQAQAHGTSHVTSATGDPAIHGENSDDGDGVLGTSVGGPGIHGEHFGVTVGPGVYGASSNGAGVYGIGLAGGPGVNGRVEVGGFPGVAGVNLDTGPGVLASANAGPGLEAYSTTGPGATCTATGLGVAGVAGRHLGANAGPGVHGQSDTAPGVVGVGPIAGVQGQSVAGFGVEGISHTGTAVAVGSLSGIGVDIHSGGIALRVTSGRLKLHQVGSGAVPAGAELVFIPRADVTANSHITVALTSDPGRKTGVSWIERAPGLGFTVHLTDRVRVATTLSFSLADPAFP